MHKLGPGPGLGDTGARKKLAIQTDASVRPIARSGTIKNMELIGPIEFRLRLIERDDLA